MVKIAQACKDEHLEFQKVGDTWDDPVLLAFHDAAWANVTPEGPGGRRGGHAKGRGGVLASGPHSHPDPPGRVQWQGVSGHGICGWKSHACPRVCRSTFAAETMASLEGIEDAMAFRASLAGELHPGRITEEACRSVVPIVPITDCRSLYDTAKREGGLRAPAPAERRLVVDLAALRQILDVEYQMWGKRCGWPTAMRWVPTDYQLADVMTKVRKPTEWWGQIRSIRLPF